MPYRPTGKNPNLTGGLPFDTPSGRKPATRPLSVSKQALTPAQAKSESSHAQSFVMWARAWRRYFPELIRTVHIPNEFADAEAVERVNRVGKSVRYSSAGAKRKAEGVTPGVLDYWNAARRRGYSGLVIDLKVRENDLTKDPLAEWDQVRERKWLESQGLSVHTCWSWAEMAMLHVWYFEITHQEVLRSIGRLDIWIVPRLGGHNERCGCNVVL